MTRRLAIGVATSAGLISTLAGAAVLIIVRQRQGQELTVAEKAILRRLRRVIDQARRSADKRLGHPLQQLLERHGISIDRLDSIIESLLRGEQLDLLMSGADEADLLIVQEGAERARMRPTNKRPGK